MAAFEDFFAAFHGGTSKPSDAPALASLYGRSLPQPLPEGNG